MKSRTLFLAMTVVLILGLSDSNALAAGSVTYLGKTNWTVTITSSTVAPPNTTFNVVGAISKAGDEFYLFQGYVTSGVSPFVMSGAGFLMDTPTGPQIIITASESQQHTGSLDSGVMRITLDLATLNGSMYDVGRDYDMTQGTWKDRITVGTLTRTGPPIASSTATQPQSLLLDE